MELFLSIEAQKTVESGLSEIYQEVNQQLSFITNKNIGLADIDNYGLEFRTISIIPTCVDDSFWCALGWKERIKIWRKKQEADIRLRMDYNRFITETTENKRLMFISIIIKSIRIIQKRSIGDFRGDMLINDILTTLNVRQTQIEWL